MSEELSASEVKELGEKLLKLAENPVMDRYPHINAHTLAHYAKQLCAGHAKAPKEE